MKATETMRSATLASRAIPSEPVPARFVSRLDGTFALSVVRGRTAAMVEVGAGFARILQTSEGRFREVLSCPASTSAAHLQNEIVGQDGVVKRRPRAMFADGTVRHDTLEVAGRRFDRRARWMFPDGASARAVYTPHGRTLECADADGAPAAWFHTRITMNPSGGPRR